MPFNASDYIKPVDSTFATDRELQGDQTDLKINDLRRDTVTCINALAGTPPSGSVTVNSINPTPTTITGAKNLVPPVINGILEQQIVSTVLGPMVLYNCFYDGVQFTSTSGSSPATGILVGGAGLSLFRQDTVGAPWTVWEKSESWTPGLFSLTNEPTGAGFSVYGSICQTGATATTFTTIIPYNRDISFVPSFNMVVSTNTNMNIGTLVMSNYNNQAVKVDIDPTAPGDVLLVFRIDVTAP